jgi:hypothetical protein
METDPMKTLTSALALTLALATSSAAGGVTYPTAGTDTYFDAHGCLVKPIFGKDGDVLNTNAVITDAGACAAQEDGPELIEDEVAAPAPTPDPIPEPVPGDEGPVKQL